MRLLRALPFIVVVIPQRVLLPPLRANSLQNTLFKGAKQFKATSGMFHSKADTRFTYSARKANTNVSVCVDRARRHFLAPCEKDCGKIKAKPAERATLGLPQKNVFAGRGDTCVQGAVAHLCGPAQNTQRIDEFKGFNADSAAISTL